MDTIKTPNLNKTIGASVGVGGGSLIGIGAVAYLHLRFGIQLSPEWAASVAASVTSAAGVAGAYLAPLLTAAQQAAIRHLNSIDRENADAVVAAASAQSKGVSK